MAQIMTLCGACETRLTDAMFKLKPVPKRTTTTEKKDSCEYCLRKFRPTELQQYIVSGR